MGEQSVEREQGADNLRRFMQRLLVDLRALERMLEEGRIERGVRRIGAEQEVFLVGPDYRAAGLAMDLLQELDDPHLTTELGTFNLEFNLDPLALGGDCLSRMEGQLNELLALVREAAARHGAFVALTGILPSLEKGDLTLKNMTPRPRYKALNDAVQRLRGREFEFRIKGADEVHLRHDNVMLEACNTSFQVHFQVGAEEFARLYNIAQAITGPVLAAATNSPLLFGKRLWRETRIALFQQSIDTRAAPSHVREQRPRVHFGLGWVRGSVLEIFQEDIARFRVLIGSDVDEDPFETLAEGGVPLLKALRLHNSTVYRWNRPCYGILDGEPHLRIENRVLPSGPTPVDEVANAAFWFGLMKGMDEEVGDVTQRMHFDHAKENFLAAARHGLGATFLWLDGREVPARELVVGELLPLAYQGLTDLGIDAGDVEHYLGVFANRANSGRTGSQWLLDSLQSLHGQGTKGERLGALTAATVARQADNKPVAEWELAHIEEAGGWLKHYSRIEQFMTTDLFTVNQDELVDLVACLMDWEHIRHVPVEDNNHRLVGLVTHRTLLRLLARSSGAADGRPIPVSDVMQENPITVPPDTPTLEAINMMKKYRIGCLPIVENERLVGIVTERDLMNVAGQLLEDLLSE
jgi:CBS domain-containing protein